MTFKDQMIDDMKNVFLNQDEFAEDIVYTPYGENARTIKALVIRERLQPDDLSDGRVLSRQYEIYIANDPTEGVTAINKGKDIISLRKFEEANYLQDAFGNYVKDNNGNYIVLVDEKLEWVVADILSQDYAFWRLLVKR